MKRALLAALALGLTTAVLAGRPLAQGPAPAEAERAGKAAFGTVYRVLLSPRCRNCHPAGARPLQFDEGLPHAQNISRTSVKNGLPCSTCHREKNGLLPNQPPGAPHWGLPPEETPMVFEGKTERELCLQLRDRKATGGRDLAALVEHVEKDALVRWGWNPGPGRTPVPVPHADFVAAMRTWAQAGGPCP